MKKDVPRKTGSAVRRRQKQKNSKAKSGHFSSTAGSVGDNLGVDYETLGFVQRRF